LATVLADPAGMQASLIWMGLTVFAGSALLMGFGVAYHRALGTAYPVSPRPLPLAPAGGILRP